MRTEWRKLGVVVFAAAAGSVAAACGTDTTAPVVPETALASVVPQGGATDVDPTEPVVVTFDHAMNPAMSQYAALHQGDVTGPEVPGTWSFSPDSMTLTFMHDTPLESGTEYTIHLGGGMMDAWGNPVDMGDAGQQMGGQWCTGEMLGGGMMGGGMGGYMGQGWQGGPDSDTYGMIFTFTTAGSPPVAPAPGDTASASASLVSVSPAGGATDVDPTSPVVVTFSHAMNPAMAEYAVLHEGDVTGPAVSGTWAFSDDSLQLVFTHDDPLKPATEYTIHLGGGMTDADGNPVDMEPGETDMGGEWCTGDMLGGGGMMGGGMGGSTYMGQGWQGGPGSDMYGMIFTFTTAG